MTVFFITIFLFTFHSLFLISYSLFHLFPMFSIHLHQLAIHAYHGLYEEEKVLGNDFVIDLTVQYHPATLPVEQLEQTINYVSLYELVKKHMQVATPLLETVVSNMAIDILAQFSLSEEVYISIRKLHPPIAQFTGATGVSLSLNRKDLSL
ncbi:MAG TPA: dihydroneopterin aldolase [Chitinophagaceae bacterium]|nr:dihydroneopterin aldolase [Chitinophagaceae bacterium]